MGRSSALTYVQLRCRLISNIVTVICYLWFSLTYQFWCSWILLLEILLHLRQVISINFKHRTYHGMTCLWSLTIKIKKIYCTSELNSRIFISLSTWNINITNYLSFTPVHTWNFEISTIEGPQMKVWIIRNKIHIGHLKIFPINPMVSKIAIKISCPLF